MRVLDTASFGADANSRPNTPGGEGLEKQHIARSYFTTRHACSELSVRQYSSAGCATSRSSNVQPCPAADAASAVPPHGVTTARASSPSSAAAALPSPLSATVMIEHAASSDTRTPSELPDIRLPDI